MPQDPAPDKTPCPICKRPVDPATRNQPGNSYPFCTQRCKLVDLGRWLDGRYQIPVVEEDESDISND